VGAGPRGRTCISRRKFLAGSAGLVALTAAGLTARQAVAASGPAPKTRSFRSRPDLTAPVVQVTHSGAQTASGYLFLTPNGAIATGRMIVDDHGRLIWWDPSGTKPTTNLKVQSLNGEPVLTWWEGQVGSGGYGQGEYVIVDRSYAELHRIHAGNGYHGDLHEFLLTGEGTALLTAYNPVPADLSSLGGPTEGMLVDCIIQEVDVGTGRVLFEWHSRDHVSPAESNSVLPAGAPFDYFHINSIDVDTDGDLLVSARNTWTIYKLDRHSGAVRWRLGGKRSDFAMADGTRFAWQHDARRQSDGSLTLFDDGASPKTESQSRGLSLVVGEAAKTVDLGRSYAHPRPLLAGSQGNLEVLPNGNVFVGWGAEPYLSEFSADGRLLFDAHMPTGEYSYRAFRFPWQARPADSPALDVRADATGNIVVSASWNGATEVDRWQVLAGESLDGLRPVVAGPWTGFETRLRTRLSQPFVAVRALDTSGTALGTSRPTQVLVRS
jgi:hypothetical protein